MSPRLPPHPRAANGRTDAGAARREALRAAARRPTFRSAARPVRDGPPARHGAVEISPQKTQPVRRIFVSYSRKDIEVVRPLIERWRSAGVTVTWDQDIPAGRDFRRAISETINGALAVIVIWSAHSVQSHFVVDEAGRALDGEKLVTTHLAGFDLRHIPLGFGHLNSVSSDDVAQVLAALAGLGLAGS